MQMKFHLRANDTLIFDTTQESLDASGLLF